MSSKPPSKPRPVYVGVGVFVLASAQESETNPRFLIGKRMGSHGAGTYALPGGLHEFGETPSECAIREVLEETGLKVINPQFLTATNDFMPAENRHWVTLFVVCTRENEADEAQTMEPDKCEGWNFVSWEDLVGWVKTQAGAQDKTTVEKDVFLPLINLVEQRPGVVPRLTGEQGRGW